MLSQIVSHGTVEINIFISANYVINQSHQNFDNLINSRENPPNDIYYPSRHINFVVLNKTSTVHSKIQRSNKHDKIRTLCTE